MFLQTQYANDMWYDMIFSVGREQIEGKGEDAGVSFADKNATVIGVFDGLGGSGARRYAGLKDHSGAYIASRAVAGACLDWSRSFCAGEGVGETELKSRIEASLKTCSSVAGSSGKSSIKGSMSVEFPTTASVAICVSKGENCYINYIWAGDSRGYLLCENGLIQITTDDAEGKDIRSSMSNDSPMNNVISLSRPWNFRSEAVCVQAPGIVITATDGCFGYWRSPMDFEYQLLDTLMESNSAVGWQDKLDNAIHTVAGDDFTLLGLSFGFRTFEKTKKKLEKRWNYLREEYINPMDELNPEDGNDYEKILDLWVRYSDTYLWEKEKQHHRESSGIVFYP